MINIFPSLTPEQIQHNIEQHWDMTRELPYPKFDITCNCGAKASNDEIQARQWSFHHRHGTGSSNPYRCDISFKCTKCSRVWTYGVVVPEEMWRKHANKRYHWREAKEILREAK